MSSLPFNGHDWQNPVTSSPLLHLAPCTEPCTSCHYGWPLAGPNEPYTAGSKVNCHLTIAEGYCRFGHCIVGLPRTRTTACGQTPPWGAAPACFELKPAIAIARAQLRRMACAGLARDCASHGIRLEMKASPRFQVAFGGWDGFRRVWGCCRRTKALVLVGRCTVEEDPSQGLSSILRRRTGCPKTALGSECVLAPCPPNWGPLPRLYLLGVAPTFGATCRRWAQSFATTRMK